MPAGLHLIFDKSALQSFSLDETNWLDHFYTTVITPLFYAEVLADLEKEVGKGKTPEEVVGVLAHKTPDMNSSPCAHHTRLASAVLYGAELPMNGRIPRGQGKVVELGDQRGIYYEKSPEEEALDPRCFPTSRASSCSRGAAWHRIAGKAPRKCNGCVEDELCHQ